MSERDMTPNPREDKTPNGDLVVSDHGVWGVRDATVVSASDRSLYRLLTEVLNGVWVPDCMPARLATACDDLVDARKTLSNISRGHVCIDGAGYGMGYCQRARDAIADHRDRDPLTLVAVGCSGSKHDPDEPVPASELYRGAYWSCKRDYGETVGADWCIISAQHAVLSPTQRVDSYERVPDDLEGVPVDSDKRLPNGDEVMTLLDQWAVRVYEGLSRWLRDTANGIDPCDVELEVLLGRTYRDPLEDRGVFERLQATGDMTVSFPFQEVEQAQGGNGNQMGWMTDEVASATAVATDGGRTGTAENEDAERGD